MSIDPDLQQHFDRDRLFHDSTAHVYDQVISEPRAAGSALLFRRIEAHLPRGGDMLDLACGTGHMLMRYGDRFQGLVGVDQSGGMLAQAQRNLQAAGLARARLQQASVFDFLKADRQRYRFISCVGFVHHLPPEMFAGLLDLIRPRLADDGVLLLAEPVQPKVSRAPWPIERWNAGSVMSERVALLAGDHEDADEAPLPEALFLETPLRHGFRLLGESRGWELYARHLPERWIDRLAIRVLDALYWRQGYIVVRVLAPG
ncbi:MAG: class I SAM-dependent methyltransferase [Xanthomonadales bacterium]|nr:class I SAM-dependent methyltransferase [Xanthomonadales bacterium]